MGTNVVNPLQINVLGIIPLHTWGTSDNHTTKQAEEATSLDSAIWEWSIKNNIWEWYHIKMVAPPNIEDSHKQNGYPERLLEGALDDKGHS